MWLHTPVKPTEKALVPAHTTGVRVGSQVVSGCADTSLVTSTCDDADRNLRIIYNNALTNFRGYKISNEI